MLHHSKNRCNKFIIAFDFDLTLLKIHSCGESISLDTIDVTHLSNLMQSWDFKRFLTNGKLSGNIKFCVVSFGHREIIEKYLKLSGLASFFDKILTPKDFGLRDGFNAHNQLKGKNGMLNFLSNYYQVGKDCIMLVDDDLQNIFLAHQSGYQTYHHNQLGLEVEDLPEIIKKIKY